MSKANKMDSTNNNNYNYITTSQYLIKFIGHLIYILRCPRTATKINISNYIMWGMGATVSHHQKSNNIADGAHAVQAHVCAAI